jgi:hypothetical protein
MEKSKLLSLMVAHIALSSHLAARGAWRADWAWGLPLIVLTVVTHVLGLGLINQNALRVISQREQRRYPGVAFAAVLGTATLLASGLHAAEAGIWALA